MQASPSPPTLAAMNVPLSITQGDVHILNELLHSPVARSAPHKQRTTTAIDIQSVLHRHDETRTPSPPRPSTQLASSDAMAYFTTPHMWSTPASTTSSLLLHADNNTTQEHQWEQEHRPEDNTSGFHSPSNARHETAVDDDDDDGASLMPSSNHHLLRFDPAYLPKPALFESTPFQPTLDSVLPKLYTVQPTYHHRVAVPPPSSQHQQGYHFRPLSTSFEPSSPASHVTPRQEFPHAAYMPSPSLLRQEQPRSAMHHPSVLPPSYGVPVHNAAIPAHDTIHKRACGAPLTLRDVSSAAPNNDQETTQATPSHPSTTMPSSQGVPDTPSGDDGAGGDGTKKPPRTCKFAQCMKTIQRHGLCHKHGGVRRCTKDGCTRKDRGEGYCVAHGGGKRCAVGGCEKVVRRGTYCLHHTPDGNGGSNPTSGTLQVA
ncbi:Aste57867_13358 [Aphanomyces stellatus]|uniref:Aste57867_13358 protein n=1 Tax=Aphanomyces stellatus TaxID=120398 RepID=A0A485KZM3_9STRA|nr:hypothetical protein As57867_013308 [Aphanomyces stellatus]VFT90197.1 Aste57867_13358 [Aphanomyces stellatus]